MDKPVVITPFRKAVDFLIQNEDIKQESDLLPIVELESAGALSNYISTKPSKKVLRLFLKAFPQVSKFFETNSDTAGGERISAREFIDTLKADKERYIRIIENNLNTINTTLGKLVDIQERFHSSASPSASDKKKPNVDKQALNPEYPDPFANIKAEHAQAEQTGSAGKGNQNKKPEQKQKLK